MAKIKELRKLTKDDPIYYPDKTNVYFVFEGSNEPIILTTRYVDEKKQLIEWFEKAKKTKEIKIVVVWPGQWRSEAFICNPSLAIKGMKD